LLAEAQILARLKEALRRAKSSRPFDVEAMVVLPDHLHCLWRLPEGDGDFSSRWRLIKHQVSIGIPACVNGRNEKAVWQRRYWEHLIRDEEDWRRHMDYIHYNPVKHGYVEAPGDWPHSSFRQCVERGWYAPDWGRVEPAALAGMEYE
jgi:putative transposase